MIMNKYIYILLGISLLMSCDNNLYMDEVIDVSFDDTKIIELKEDTVTLEDPITGQSYIKDSLLLMYSSNYNDFLMQVYRLVDGKRIASLLPIGKAKDEFPRRLKIQWDEGNEISKEEWGMWTYDRAKGEYKLINISRSVKENTTIVDSIIKYNNVKAGFRYAFGKVYFGHNYIYGRMQEYKQEDDDEICVPVKYYKCKISNHLEIIGDINIYKKGVSIDENMHSLSSYDTYNPFRGEIALAMGFLPQLNILNLEDETAKGYCYEHYSSFKSVLQNRKEDKWVSVDIASNEKYIYVLTTEGCPKLFPPCGNIINVFDWEGNPIHRLRTPTRLSSISIDQDLLYGQDTDYNCYQYQIEY